MYYSVEKMEDFLKDPNRYTLRILMRSYNCRDVFCDSCVFNSVEKFVCAIDETIQTQLDEDIIADLWLQMMEIHQQYLRGAHE